MSNDVRPATLDEIIGQTDLVNKCKLLIKASDIRDAPLPHMLFTGPSGYGKTTFARAVAHDYGSKVILANGAAIKSIKIAKQYLEDIEKFDILFIDEIHRMPTIVCEFLYTVMEDFRFDAIEKGYDDHSHELHPFTVIGATTMLGHLPTPLQGRFKYVEEFQAYSMDELVKLVHRIAKIYNFTLSDISAKVIAKTCKGNPRNIVSRTEAVRDYMIGTGITNMTSKELQDVIYMLQGVDSNGLDRLDRKYIEYLNKVNCCSLTTLVAAIDTDVKTVKENIEPYLIKLGLLNICPSGRFINKKMYNKLLKGTLDV